MQSSVSAGSHLCLRDDREGRSVLIAIVGKAQEAAGAAEQPFHG
jgi:hypothetical protein